MRKSSFSFSNLHIDIISNIVSYTPEIFPTKDRGTGNALTAMSNRVFGIMAPIVAIYANLETAAPVYVSGALFIAAGVIVTILPYEPRGKASL
jgi:sugar phosphate permease